jgi:hypothetical protein
MARRTRTPEGDVSDVVRGALRCFGVRHWRVNSGALRDRTGRLVFFIRDEAGKGFGGFSDRVGILPGTGRMIAVEVKARGGGVADLSPQQRVFLETIAAAGGVALCVADVDVLLRALERLKADPAARFAIDGTPEDGPCRDS